MDINSIIKESYLNSKTTLSSQDERIYLFIDELFKIELSNQTNHYFELLVRLLPLSHCANKNEAFIHYLELIGITSSHPSFNDLVKEFSCYTFNTNDSSTLYL